MNVLAFDTASPAPAIALLWDGRAFEERLPAERRASEALLPALSSLLRDAGAALQGLSRIAVCAGPGSFTGVRVGLATAWGLGRTLAIPLESVSTLEAMAEGARTPGLRRVCAALDAGRGEAIIGLFALDEDRARLLQEIEKISIERVASRLVPEETVCLPAELLGFRALPLSVSPAMAAARAVARAPRERAAALPAAIYARASAAEEKLGAP